MRQLITRVDDDLHERLRALAAAEGRSMASVVRDAIATALHRSGAATTLDDRIAASGLVTRPPRPQVVPPRSTSTTGGVAGTASTVSEALQADRDGR